MSDGDDQYRLAVTECDAVYAGAVNDGVTCRALSELNWHIDYPMQPYKAPWGLIHESH